MEQITVKIDSIIFIKDYFSILGCSNKQGIYTVRGNNLPRVKNIYFTFFGRFESHPKYGTSFVAEYYVMQIDKTKEGIISLLTKIKGIGEKAAERIFDEYGFDSLDLFAECKRDELVKFKGLSSAKVDAAIQDYEDQMSYFVFAAEIESYGIPIKYTKAIMDSGITTIKQILDDPYRLCEDVRGINVFLIDELAFKLGIERDSDRRIYAHALYILTENELSGNTCIWSQDFYQQLKVSLNLPPEKENALNTFFENVARENMVNHDVKDKYLKIICFDDSTADLPFVSPDQIFSYIAKRSTYMTENRIADFLLSLVGQKKIDTEIVRQRVLDICKKMNNIVLDEVQMQAVIGAITNHLYIITGGPGTGKTTVIKVIARYFEEYENEYRLLEKNDIISYSDKENKMMFLAPSGKAARNIKANTGYKGQTVHNGLQIDVDLNAYGDVESLGDKTVFIDEISMVDVFLFKAILSRFYHNDKTKMHLILIGDKDQLQSVGPGAILRDMLRSGKIPYTCLTKIYRQQGDNIIPTNAKRVIDGDTKLETRNEFVINVAPDSKTAEQWLISHYAALCKRDGINNIYCILPRLQGTCGVEEINKKLQEAVNPYSENKLEWHGYRVGDPVMHLKNDKIVSNGDIGYVQSIHVYKHYDADLQREVEDKTLIVKYFEGVESVLVEYSTESSNRRRKRDAVNEDGINTDNKLCIDDLTLAYAFTVHKSQGSQNKIILTYLSKECGKKMLSRNLLYTAITRATEQVEIIMTNDNCMDLVAVNETTELRLTTLHQQLTNFKRKE